MAKAGHEDNTTPPSMEGAPKREPPEWLKQLRAHPPFSEARREQIQAALPSEEWCRRMRALFPSDERLEQLRAENDKRAADEAEAIACRREVHGGREEREKRAAVSSPAVASAPAVTPQPSSAHHIDDRLIAAAIRLKASKAIPVRAQRYKDAFARLLVLDLKEADPTAKSITWRTISEYKLERLKIWPIDLIPDPSTD